MTDPGEAFTWPPTLPMLKVDMRIDDNRDDATLSQELAAVIGYVERVKGSQVDLYGVDDPSTPVTDPAYRLPLDDGYVFGALRLAARQHARRRSPDGMVASLDTGSVRVGTGDSDIDRMLRVGRFASPVIA
jgi:hypothetical protein